MFTGCSKFERNRTIPGWIVHNLSNFSPYYVTLWPWPLTPWFWTFVVLWVSSVQMVYKIRAKSNNPRQSYWRFRTLSPSNFRGWGNISGFFSGVCGLKFVKRSEDIGRSSTLGRCVSEFRHLAQFCCIFKRRCLKFEWCRKWGQISQFLTPPPVKLGKGCARSLSQ